MAIEYFHGEKSEWPPAYYNGVLMTGNRSLPKDTGYQITFNHNLQDLGRGDDGGPWLLERTVYTHIFGSKTSSNGPNVGYHGPTLPWDDNSFYLPSIGTLRTDASYYSDGAKAIAATEPTKATFNGSVFLGETLSDGLPKMAGYQTWRDHTLRAKQAGGEYLNYQFGWVPFVSDLRDFAHAVSHSHDIIQNYRRNSDIKIRRRMLISDTTSGQQTEEGLKFIRTFGSKSVGSTMTRYNSSLRERMWFSGAYRYHVPVDDSTLSRIRRYRQYAHRLYGVDLTPNEVWNIAPWSWAIDWKTDIGAVIHNWSALGHNGLVLQYGYIMHEQVSNWTASSDYGFKSVSFIRKRRVAANPYGFGVSLSGLNTQQVAVLAALG